MASYISWHKVLVGSPVHISSDPPPPPPQLPSPPQTLTTRNPLSRLCGLPCSGCFPSVESHTMWFLLSGFSHWASSSQVHPCVSMPLSFSCWIIFQYVYMPWWVCPSSVAGYVGCFHFLTIVNCAAVNIRVQVLMWMYVSSSWAEISDWNYRAIWWFNVNLSTGFPTWLYHLYESSSFYSTRDSKRDTDV